MMNSKNRYRLIEKTIQDGNGILRLAPAWVARELPAPGRRLGLPEDAYDLGPRGAICERWLASTTPANNRLGVPDEGLSFVLVDEQPVFRLKEAISLARPLLMGGEYARNHAGLGRLAKIFDHADRIPFHYHQQASDAARVGMNPKEEAYYFPEGVNLGPHPETFFGLHPWIAEQKAYEVLLPYLQDWDSDLILRHSRAYLQVPGDGFHVPAGVLHAPGSALTLELQEDSDAFAIIQARVARQIISKDFLFKCIHPDDRAKLGERVILGQIDWETSGDPYFYQNRHTPPLPVADLELEGVEEHWIFYNTTKFSGKRLVIAPGKAVSCQERGVYSLLVWRGQGRFDGLPIKAGDFNHDELLVAHQRAIQPHDVENTGSDDLVIFKFFGPDINPDVPMLS
jgi:hypothetical protein